MARGPRYAPEGESGWSSADAHMCQRQHLCLGAKEKEELCWEALPGRCLSCGSLVQQTYCMHAEQA